MRQRVSHRKVLVASAGAVAATAGCQALTPDFVGADVDFERPDSDETVPDTVAVAWRRPEHNPGEHTAANASAVPLAGGGVVFPGDTGYLTALSGEGDVLWEDGETGGGAYKPVDAA